MYLVLLCLLAATESCDLNTTVILIDPDWNSTETPTGCADSPYPSISALQDVKFVLSSLTIILAWKDPSITYSWILGYDDSDITFQGNQQILILALGASKMTEVAFVNLTLQAPFEVLVSDGTYIFEEVKCTGSFGGFGASGMPVTNFIIRNSEFEDIPNQMFSQFYGCSLEITNSVFRNLTGGILTIQDIAVEFTRSWAWNLTNSQFLQGNGPAILMESISHKANQITSHITMTNCTWSGFTQIILKTIADNTIISIDRCSFLSNQAGIEISRINYPFSLTNSVFLSNNGTAVTLQIANNAYLTSGTQLLLIDQIIFQNNGQGILLTSGQSGAFVNITRSQFLQNGNPSINGGCVSLSSALLSLSSLHFEDCVGSLGPAIYLSDTSYYEISEVDVWNTVGQDGVGLYVNVGRGLIQQFSLYNLMSLGSIIVTNLGQSTNCITLTIQNCTAGSQILFGYENTWNIAGLVLTNSNAGSLLINYIAPSEDSVIRDSIFYNSLSQSIHYHSGYNTMKFINCTFDFPNRSEMILFSSSGRRFGMYNCVIRGYFHSIFSGLSTSLQFELIDSFVADSTVYGLLEGNFYTSNIRNSVFKNVTIVKSSSSLLLVTFNFFNVTLTNVRGNIITLAKSVLRMEAVLISEVQTYGTDQMLVGSSTKFSIINSVLANFTGFAANSLLSLSENSVFNCVNSSFSNLTQTKQNGLNSITRSNVTLTNVIFDNWNVTLFDAELSRFWLINCILTRGGSGSPFSNTAKYNGGLINGLHVIVWMQSTIVADIGASSGGVLYLLYNNPTLPIFSHINEFSTFAVILNNTFTNTSALIDGGAFYIAEGSTTISNSTFRNSQAEQDGGFFYLICNPQITHYLCRYSIEDTKLSDSLAGRNGGTIYYSRVKPTMRNVSSKNTTAIYGQFIAGYPIRVGFLNNITLLEVPPYAITETSGLAIEKPLYLGLFDHQDALVSTNSLSKLAIRSNLSSVSLSGVVDVTANHGVYLVDSITVIAAPGSTPKLSLTSDAIDYLNMDSNTGSFIQPTTLAYMLRNCTLGEIVKEKQCFQCGKDSYSYNTTDTLCKQCKPGMTCNGGTNINININYWRAAEDSDEVFECYVNGVCVGESHCAEGYTGRLCSVCAGNWFRLGKHKCAKCGNLSISIVQGVFIILAVVCYLAYLIHSGLKNVLDKKKSELSVQLKIVLNFVQVMMLMNNFQIVWPDVLSSYFDGLYTSGNSSQMAFSLECYSSEATFKYVYQKLIVMTVLPAVIILASLFPWGVVSICKRDLKYLTQHSINTICVLLQTIHPMVLQASAQMFTCLTMESNTPWLVADLTIQCWNGDHSKYVTTMVIPDLIIWCVGIPLTFCILLVRNRNRFTESAVARRFAFLYSGYQRNTYYWEIVIMVRKSVFVLISSFLSSVDRNIEASTGLLVILAFLQIHDLKHPFSSVGLNEFETYSLLTVLVTMFCGILYATTLGRNEVTYYLMVAIVIGVNANFLLRFLLSVYKKVGAVLVQKWPRLRVYFCLSNEVVYTPAVVNTGLPESQFQVPEIEGKH